VGFSLYLDGKCGDDDGFGGGLVWLSFIALDCLDLDGLGFHFTMKALDLLRQVSLLALSSLSNSTLFFLVSFHILILLFEISNTVTLHTEQQ
jgi:hypothetical protein